MTAAIPLPCRLLRGKEKDGGDQFQQKSQSSKGFLPAISDIHRIGYTGAALLDRLMNGGEPPTAQLAERLGVSRATLDRSFADDVGLSPSRC